MHQSDEADPAHLSKSNALPRRPVTDINEGVTSDYYVDEDTDLVGRWRPLTEWLEHRWAAELDPYSKYTDAKIGPRLDAFDRKGRTLGGVNFASQDYLNLSSHPAVIEAACHAAQIYGVHSAGSAALMGLTRRAVELEARIASFLDVADATLFPTGWGAGFGVIRTLIRPKDHVVIDILAHACLQEAAALSTNNVHRFPHCSTDAVERRLRRIRKDNPDAGILVVTETVFSMDSDVPQIRPLIELCRDHKATLLVDVAHDLGAIGPTGRGYLEIQGVLGEVDIVMGSFSKTFASNGGFVATNNSALKLALRYNCGPLTFTNSLSPVQIGIIHACLDIITSQQGRELRTRLMANIHAMRSLLQDEGFTLLGAPSAIVPILVGDNAMSRHMTSHLLSNGALVNLVEYPAVARNACRWRVQVMAEHSTTDIEQFVELAVAAQRFAMISLGRVSAQGAPKMNSLGFAGAKAL